MVARPSTGRKNRACPCNARSAFGPVKSPAGRGENLDGRQPLLRALFECGRYWYKGDKWRIHFTHMQSHNSILIDGAGPEKGSEAVDRPMTKGVAITKAFDFARGTFNAPYLQLKGAVAHTRAVVCLLDDRLLARHAYGK